MLRSELRMSVLIFIWETLCSYKFWMVLLTYMIFSVIANYLRAKIIIEREQSQLFDFNEEAIIKHLEFIISEAFNQYLLFNLVPSNIYYIKKEKETEIINYMIDKVANMISPTLYNQLKFIYHPKFINEAIASHIHLVVLNYVIEFNTSNNEKQQAKKNTRPKINTQKELNDLMGTSDTDNSDLLPPRVGSSW